MKIQNQRNCLETTIRQVDEQEQEQEQKQQQTLSSFELLELCPSLAMQGVCGLVRKCAAKNCIVLILGETGVGKGVVGKAIHEQSPRSNGPFVQLNCGNYTETLMEDAFFGHEKGAFTGAYTSHRGVFERADMGTLFLDEIGELGLDQQTRLLHVLDDKQFVRVGGNSSVASDFRLVAATNRDPEEMVRCGKMRRDLFYRLNVFDITVPPLRERRADVETLAKHFLAELDQRDPRCSFDSASLGYLEDRAWNGNVRELRNAIERALLLLDDDSKVILPQHLQCRGKTPETSANSILDEILGFMERQQWDLSRLKKELTLHACNKYGHKSKAAKFLGVSRQYIPEFNNEMQRLV